MSPADKIALAVALPVLGFFAAIALGEMFFGRRRR